MSSVKSPIVFISSNLIVIALSVWYLRQRERITATADTIEAINLVFLKNVLAQQNFFTYSTKNGAFFQTSQSSYLNEYQDLLNRALQQIEKPDQNAGSFEISDSLQFLKIELEQVDSLFKYLVEKVKERGYKDYSLEGSMREDAHWLEAIKEIPTQFILTLRRHEKDYIIRNEETYAKN